MFKILLSLHPNCKTDAIQLACSKENISMIIALILEMSLFYFEESFNQGCRSGSLSVIQYLKKQCYQPMKYCLSDSVYFQYFRVSSFLISNGADLNEICPSYKKTPLEIAFSIKSVPFFVLLLSRGAWVPQSLLIKIQENKIFEKIVSDYNQNKLWNIERNDYFATNHNLSFFFILVSLKIETKKHNLRVPKPIIHLILQYYVSSYVS